MPFNFQSPGAAAAVALEKYLVDREVERREQMLARLTEESHEAQRQRVEQDRQRQDRLDKQAQEDRQRRIAAEDKARDLAPYAPGDLVDDSIGKRHPDFVRDGQFIGTPQQRDVAAKEAVRLQERDSERQRQELRDKDAVANRYLDSERDRQEAERQRANARYIVDRQMKGKAEPEADHNPAAITIDALDELSESINRQEGIAAKVAGSWKHAAASANYDDDVAEYEATLAGAIPLIARKMGHTGVLTQADVDSVRGMMPRPGDSKSLRDRKIRRIRQIMNMAAPAQGDSGNNGKGGGKSSFRVTVE